MKGLVLPIVATLTLVALTSSGPAWAQQDSGASPLQGRVEFQHQDEPLRITRPKPGQARALPVQNFRIPSKGQQGKNPGLTELSTSFSEAPPGQAQKAIKAPVPGRKPPVLKASDTRNVRKTAPYIWQLSTQGGYYDVSQNIKHVVQGKD